MNDVEATKRKNSLGKCGQELSILQVRDLAPLFDKVKITPEIKPPLCYWKIWQY